MVPALKAAPGRDIGDLGRIREYSIVLRQALLHRATKLTMAAGESLANNNGYSLALNVRAHFETTASIGYLHYRLNSMREGNITPEIMDRDILIQLLGTRDGVLLNQTGANGFEAKQILTMLEYADKSASQHVLGRKSYEHKMLVDIYKWLCEFCHPNFHSNKLAFNLDHKEGTFVFRHEGALDKEEASILVALLISVPVFVAFYDGVEKLLP